MNSLCSDIGISSINKFEEPICGDHVEIVHAEDITIVLCWRMDSAAV
jgi:alpha-tubulin suppressor-like RCC1 family protein